MQSIFSLLLVAWIFSCPKIMAIEIGDLAPEINLPSLIEAEVVHSLEEKLGEVIYVDFWASWCAPCRLSMPVLEQLYSEFSADGFTVYAVNVDEIREDALNFIEDIMVSYPLLADPDGLIPELYAIIGMPTGVLIDRKGVVSYLHVGYRSGDESALREKITYELDK